MLPTLVEGLWRCSSFSFAQQTASPPDAITMQLSAYYRLGLHPVAQERINRWIAALKENPLKLFAFSLFRKGISSQSSWQRKRKWFGTP